MRRQLDQRIWLALGRAVARAQVLELALVKLAEAQRQDTTEPLDERWAEVSGWLGMTAGRLRGLLSVPHAVATDSKHAVDRRNRVVDHGWMLYSLGRDRQASADTWAPWLDDERLMFALVREGVARMIGLVRATRERGDDVDAELERVARKGCPRRSRPGPTSSARPPGRSRVRTGPSGVPPAIGKRQRAAVRCSGPPPEQHSQLLA